MIRPTTFLHFSAALFITLTVTECLLRLFILSPTATQSDEELGWTYLPNASILNTSEGYFRDQLNRLGLNDKEVERKPSGQFRALVLGDSYTEAFQVDRSSNFTSLAEQKTCADVVNAGRAGMTIVHYNVIAKRLRTLDFDEVVIVLSGADVDDLRNTDFTIEQDQANQSITHIKLRAETLSPYRELLDPILRHSALATYLKNRLRLLQMEAPPSHSKPEAHKKRPPVFKSQKDQREIEAIFRYVFNDIRNISKLALLYLPDYRYINGGETYETDKSLDVSNFLKSLANELNIPFTKGAGFPEYYAKEHQPPVGFSNSQISGGHMNQAGHRLVAFNLAELIGNHCGPQDHPQ